MTATFGRFKIHFALRRWLPPMGAAINVPDGIFKDGICSDAKTAEMLGVIGAQIVEFAEYCRAD